MENSTDWPLFLISAIGVSFLEVSSHAEAKFHDSFRLILHLLDCQCAESEEENRKVISAKDKTWITMEDDVSLDCLHRY